MEVGSRAEQERRGEKLAVRRGAAMAGLSATEVGRNCEPAAVARSLSLSLAATAPLP
jgi:hypothetical protein